jgi:hypothetical protein
MAGVEFRLDIPDTPLEGDLHIGRQWAGQFGMDFVEGVNAALTYSPDQPLQVLNASGRNYYIPLPEPAGPYDALQVAGGGNFDLGITTNSGVQDSIVDPESGAKPRVVAPPAENPDLFTSYTLYHEDGQDVEKQNINPIGSYSAQSAARKIEQTELAFATLAARHTGVITPKYVGKFEYALDDQNGEPQTAILMLVPSMGMRFDSKLLVPLTAMRAGRSPEPGSDFAEELIPYHQAVISPRLFCIGAGMATMHRSGLVHHQMTPGNSDALTMGNKLVPYITDWDTATVPDESDRVRSQAIDMVIALQTASAAIKRLTRLEMIGRQTAAGLVIDTVVNFLSGYFESKGEPPSGHLGTQDAVNIAVGSYDTNKSLDTAEAWLA